MIQRANRIFEAVILDALSATVKNVPYGTYDVTNKIYVDSQLSNITVSSIGNGVDLAVGGNRIRTLSAGAGVTLISAASTISLSTNVATLSTLGIGTSLYSLVNGSLNLKSLSGGDTIVVRESNGTIIFDLYKSKTLTTIVSTAGLATYNVPLSCYQLDIEVVGGGGGGGSGKSQDATGSGNYIGGGGGGGGGGYGLVRLTTQLSSTSSLTLSVGSGGSGGTSVHDNNGNIGSTGGASYVQHSTLGIIISAQGGFAGAGGLNTGVTGGSGGAVSGTLVLVTSAIGGSGGTTDVAGTTLSVGPGGGGGAGHQIVSGAVNGGANGGGPLGGNGGSSSAGSSPGGTGANATAFTLSAATGGGGGGGGGASWSIVSNDTAGAGGNGFAGGGGGGGSSAWTSNGFQAFGGAGGTGGNGFIRVTAYTLEGLYINSGAGYQLLDNATGIIRTLSSTGTVSLLSSSDVITVSGQPLVNLGTGTLLADVGSNSIRSLSALGPITLLSAAGIITLSAQSNTNIGAGVGLSDPATSSIRSLSTTGPLALISATDLVTLSAPPYTPNLNNIGAGTALADPTTSGVRTLCALGSVVLLSSTGVITISGGPSGGGGGGTTYTNIGNGTQLIDNPTASIRTLSGGSGVTLTSSASVVRVDFDATNVNWVATKVARVQDIAGDYQDVVITGTVTNGPTYDVRDINGAVVQVGATTTYTPVGTGVQIIDTPTLTVKSLYPGTGFVVTSAATNITFSVDPNYLNIWVPTTTYTVYDIVGRPVNVVGAGTLTNGPSYTVYDVQGNMVDVGATSTYTNVGSANTILNSSTLQAKTLSAGTNISVISGANTLTISSPIGVDGWIQAQETWTFASGTTFTISGDLTLIYKKGDKIKWTQTTVKYAYIVGIAFSAGTTTITICAGSDYSIANAAITNNYYSRVTNPFGFPDVFNWVPTFGGFSVAPPLAFAHFSIHGAQCFFHMYCNNNGTSNSTSTTFTLPLAVSTSLGSNGSIVADGWCRYVDNGSVGSSPGLVQLLVGTTTANAFINAGGGTWTASAGKRVVSIQMNYEY